MKRRMRKLMAMGLMVAMCGNASMVAVQAQDISVDEKSVVEQTENVESLEAEQNSSQIDASLQIEEANVNNGWSSDRVYYYENGVPVKGIKSIQGVLYYFDYETGVLNKKAQWIEQSGKKYFCNAEGVLYQDCFISFGPTYYYMGNDGSVQSGIVKAHDGKLYYMNEDGILQKKAQWIKQSGKKYFCNAEGVLYQDCLISFGSTYYCMGEDGSVQYGVSKVGNCYYYTDTKTGILVKKAGWREQEGKRYFSKTDGSLYQNQFISFGPTYYYMGNDGSVQKGIVKAHNGRLYYMNADGILQKKAQWIEQSGKKYFCNAEGVLYQDCLISFGSTYYCMGEDGSVQYGVSKVGNCYYYTDTNTGVLVKKAGWREQEGKRYFSKNDGSLYQNQFISFGSTYYYCGNDAAIIVNAKEAIEGVVYQFDENGIMMKEGGWGEYAGRKYFKNPATGFPYMNQWVTFGRTWYYADVHGLMVSGWNTINGYNYYFYPNTNQMARNTKIDGIQILDNGMADVASTYAVNILNQIGWNLQAAYNWSASLEYKNVSDTPAPGSEYFAKYGFQNKCGDCYVMAATFYYMAKMMGYDAHQITGYVPRRGGGKTPHSWVEINIDGTIYVYDPDFTAELGRNGFQVTYGASGTWKYMDWYRMN